MKRSQWTLPTPWQMYQWTLGSDKRNFKSYPTQSELDHLISRVLTSKLMDLAVLRKRSATGDSKHRGLGRIDWFESISQHLES